MKTQFVTNNTGKKLGVFLPMKEYNRMIEELEMKADVKLYDMAKSDLDIAIPIDEAFKLLDAKRKGKR